MKTPSLISTVLVFAAGLILLAAAEPALPAALTPVKIEVKTNLTKASHPGTFTTSGAALCRRGTSSDKEIAPPRRSGDHWSFHFRKTFTCGSGTFAAIMQGRLVVGRPTWSGAWKIVAGTGAYAKLRGAGTLVGDELPGRVNDHLAGSVHFG